MIRYANFRGGVSTSPLLAMDMLKLTGKQKLDMIRCRIFGSMIGGNHHSGLKTAKSNLSALRRSEYYTDQFWFKRNPFSKTLGTSNRGVLHMYKTIRRNALRGIKLNKKKGGISFQTLSQFGVVKKDPGMGKGDKKKSKGLLHSENYVSRGRRREGGRRRRRRQERRKEGQEGKGRRRLNGLRSHMNPICIERVSLFGFEGNTAVRVIQPG